MSEHACYECGGAHPVVVRQKRVARWGKDNPAVEVEDELYRCPKCGDGFYTLEQAQASERTLWLTTIDALRTGLAEREAECARLRAVIANQLTQHMEASGEYSSAPTPGASEP